MEQNNFIFDSIRTESRTISLEVILDYLSKVLLFRITTRSARTYTDYPLSSAGLHFFKLQGLKRYMCTT